MKLFVDLIINLGILINTLILYILWKNGRSAYHYKILFIIFLLVLLTQICFLGYAHKNTFIFYGTFIFQDIIPITIGPLLYLYVKAIFLHSKHIWKKNWKHFLTPALYALLASIPKLLKMQNNPDVFNHLRSGLENAFAFSIVYSLIYCFLSLKILKKGQHLIKEHYSNTNKLDLGWLKKLLYGTILIICTDIFITIFELTFGDFEGAIYPIAVIVMVLIVHLAYHGILQTEVLIPEFLLKKHGWLPKDEIIETPISTTPNKVIDYDRSEMHDLQQKLQAQMIEEQWFLNPVLCLNLLAEKLAITDKKLSFLLNQHMNTTFYDYVNQLRVTEVQKKLKDPKFKNFTLLAIGLESGFNSKASFNRTFNRFTGMTPSQFKKRLL